MFSCFLLLSQVLAQQADLKFNPDKDLKIDADTMELQKREGLTIFSGNVVLTQGNKLLRADKMIVHSITLEEREKLKEKVSQQNLIPADADRIDVFGKVYAKIDNQFATGDRGLLDRKSNMMILSGIKVILTDGANIASGCRLTVHIDTGNALLESCSLNHTKGRVSIMMTPKSSS
jgi:lipopolysaccharide export system protein LptA